MTKSSNNLSVAFVCTGNICRSTMAEGVFAHLVKQMGLEDKFDKIDSFGVTGYHVGDSPDYRTSQVLKANGIQYHHRGQKISSADFNKFDFLFGMDSGHVRAMNRIKPKGSKAKVVLFGEYNDSKSGLRSEIADPWYDADMAGFEMCFEQVNYFSKKFLEEQF